MGELFDSVRQVVDFIYRFEWIYNLEIEQCVDFRLHVVLGDNVLLGEVIHLFPEVDIVGIYISSSHHRYNILCPIYKGDYDVDTWLEGSMIATEPLDNSRFRLWDDDKRHLCKQKNANHNNY